jgi:hypothetical protein
VGCRVDSPFAFFRNVQPQRFIVRFVDHRRDASLRGNRNTEALIEPIADPTGHVSVLPHDLVEEPVNRTPRLVREDQNGSALLTLAHMHPLLSRSSLERRRLVVVILDHASSPDARI